MFFRITFTWQNGRQLASLQTADNSVSYKYDSNGMRTQKTDNSGTTYYYYDSDKNLIGLTKDNATLLFYYDSNRSVTSFKYNGTMYYYIKNLQGDIVKIINQSGTEIANYVYDAWGNIKYVSGDSVLRELNPFRYRGYVYDEESNLYYLQSRYYDPFTGRFINADDTSYVGATGTALSTNIFTYCDNNPINNVDHTGQWYKTLKEYKKKAIDPIYAQRNMYEAMGYRTKYNEYDEEYNSRKNFKKRVSYIYKKNKKKSISSSGYIYGQSTSEYGSFLFGSASTVSKSGCAAVALYNAMLKIKKKKDLAHIIMEFELNSMLGDYGQWGTHSDAIWLYLKSHKVSFKEYTSFKTYKKNAKKYRASVVIIEGHAFCIIRKSNELYTLNRYNFQKKAENVYWTDIEKRFVEVCCIK